MIGKLVRSGALALAAFSLVCAPATAFSAKPYLANPYIKQVDCDGGKGSAFQISNGLVLSVNHVTRLTGCAIDGKPYTLLYANEEEDFSILQAADTLAGGIKVDCGGYRDGEFVFSVGYAYGMPAQRVVTLRYSAAMTAVAGGGRFAVLYGAQTVIPGMSGGPILNRKGQVVGMINAYNPHNFTSFSREIRRTPICQS